MKPSYRPVLILFGYLLLGSLMSYLLTQSFHKAMMIFMGSFFIAFSYFKFIDYNGFVKGFKKYDLVAQKIPGWAHLYPFIELYLGTAFLLRWNLKTTLIITLVVHSFSLIGILWALKKGKKINCACMGTVLNVPLGGVTILENSAMLIMALFMLLY